MTADDTVAAMSVGARDHVAYEDQRDLRHLELVALREIASHQRHRELRATQKRLATFESRHEELISGTNDAGAYIQEGILSNANPAFAQLLGHADAGALAGVPLMDLVAPDFVPKVREQLRLLLRGKADNARSTAACSTSTAVASRSAHASPSASRTASSRSGC